VYKNVFDKEVNELQLPSSPPKLTYFLCSTNLQLAQWCKWTQHCNKCWSSVYVGPLCLSN